MAATRVLRRFRPRALARHAVLGKATGLLGALLALTAIGGHGSVAVAAEKPGLTVMTRNQYLGAEIQSLAGAPDPPTFIAGVRAALLQIAENDFPERARALAREIADKQPDVVGLQEVYDFRLSGVNGPPPFVDHLAETLDALAERGTPYVAVASVLNLDLTLPADLDGDGTPESFVTIRDRDVILVRQAIVDAGDAVPVSLSDSCVRPSADGGPGCNYQVVASVVTPLGSVDFERGYVAVDVTVHGETYRFVNTHLEVQRPDPSNPLSPYIQAAQATELKTVLELVTPADLRLVIVGDINSSPEDLPFPDPVTGPFRPPYWQFAEGKDLFGMNVGLPWIDTWKRRPGNPPGYTCCQAEDLSNQKSSLVERIDIVFTRETPTRVKANLVGDNRADKTPAGLWPSDHAGVFTRLWY